MLACKSSPPTGAWEEEKTEFPKVPGPDCLVRVWQSRTILSWLVFIVSLDSTRGGTSMEALPRSDWPVGISGSDGGIV